MSMKAFAKTILILIVGWALFLVIPLAVSDLFDSVIRGWVSLGEPACFAAASAFAAINVWAGLHLYDSFDDTSEGEHSSQEKGLL